MAGSDISDYEFIDKGNGVFQIKNKKIRLDEVMRFGLIDGKYYFMAWSGAV